MTTAAAAPKYLIDSYLDWTGRQGIQVVEGAAIDLSTVATAPWPRLGPGCRAAFVHLRGRGDFVALQVIEIPPGGATAQARHLYDEVFYVISGHGSAAIETGTDRNLTVEWGPRSLFTPPLNAAYRLFNASREKPARIVCANDLPFVMNVFRDDAFLFDNPIPFPQRADLETHYAGNTDFTAADPDRQVLETSFIRDLAALALPEWKARGGGSRNAEVILPGTSMHVHLSEIPAGTYNKGRIAAGPHVFPLAGTGYTLNWSPGDGEFERHDWRPGLAFVAPDDRFHQHFNTGPQPSRHFAISFGSHRYPVLARLVKRYHAPMVSVKDGGPQVDFEDQDPRIHAMWERELARTGVASRMGKYFDKEQVA